MEGGMNVKILIVSTLIVGAVIASFAFAPEIDRILCGESCAIDAAEDQSIPPWERPGHVPSTPSQSEEAPPAVSQELAGDTQSVETTSTDPVGGVDPWGVSYDELATVPAEGPRTTCAFVHLVRGVRRDTPIEIRDAFVSRVLTRICTPPPSERSFPEGVICEPSLQRDDGTFYGRDFCYTARRWRS